MERVDDRTDNAHKTCCGDLFKNMPQNNKYYQNKFYIVKTIIAGFNCSVHYYSPFCFSCGDAVVVLKKKTPKSLRALEYKDNAKIISLRTVTALRKQSCGLFLAGTAGAVLRGHRSDP